MKKHTIFWFRRDLRLHDNAGLYRALKASNSVLPLFIFDKNILDELPKQDARVEFIHHTIEAIKTNLQESASDIIVKYGDPIAIYTALIKEYDIEAVYTNHDYEPYAKDRDTAIKQLLTTQNIDFKTYKDQVIFEKNEVTKDDGLPYTVFTPYSRKWRAALEKKMSKIIDVNGNEQAISYFLKSYPNHKYFDHFAKIDGLPLPSLEDMGFEPTDIPIPDKIVTRGLIKNYAETRDFPAITGTSRLGLHFRFGTISIREKARNAQNLSTIFVNELIWRDFYSQIMWHFPHVIDAPFRAKYSFIDWRDSEEDFQKWCEGKTGYPIVDAGMRELNHTGHMHNRVRMVVASFLTKHLLINWQRGEAYFAEKLLDFDLASNNGGWQWAAGCGTDAAPYFRVFNPYSQQKKFDKDFKYIKKWVPEYGTSKYVEAMVDHKFARERCLAAYKFGLAKAETAKS